MTSYVQLWKVLAFVRYILEVVLAAVATFTIV